MFCAHFTRPRYQVSVYRTIGPLVLFRLKVLIFSCIFLTGLYKAANADLSGTEKLNQYET